jgi:hypothetical protein
MMTKGRLLEKGLPVTDVLSTLLTLKVDVTSIQPLVMCTSDGHFKRPLLVFSRRSKNHHYHAYIIKIMFDKNKIYLQIKLYSCFLSYGSIKSIVVLFYS